MLVLIDPAEKPITVIYWEPRIVVPKEEKGDWLCNLHVQSEGAESDVVD